MKYTALDIAKWFVTYTNFLNTISDEDIVSNLKIQKLLYYAQGCYLGLKNEELFNDELLAWEHGPVVEEVYHYFKKYGSGSIPVNTNTTKEMSDFEDIQDFLIAIYGRFGKYSAWGLRNMTHSEDPWKNAGRNKVISKDLIKKYFVQEYIQKS